MAARHKLSIKKHYRAETKSRLNKNIEVYLAIYSYFMSSLLFEMKCFIKLSKMSNYEGLCFNCNSSS